MTDRFDPDRLAASYRRVRALSEALASPLAPEDQCIQSMPDASPTKWHLAHTSWFFETFVLAEDPLFRPPKPEYATLFNSYYQTVGPMHPRPQRGLLSRPTVAEVLRYRSWTDEQVLARLERGATPRQLGRIELGLHHEQQHQELLLTDIQHAFSINPLWPRYRESWPRNRESEPAASNSAGPLRWVEDPGGLVEIGRELGPDASFGFDNEGPRHRVWLEPFAIASRPATNREYLEFITDQGYRRPELWLAEGWDVLRQQGWQAPGYWVFERDRWQQFSLEGLHPIDLDAPVCHVSFYEADAFARWSNARLPSEAEWERTAIELPASGNLLPSRAAELASASLRPRASAGPIDEASGLTQMFGDVWEWTASPYSPYPGFRPAAGAVGEYNGKFMCNQMVLRGGSCATPADHVRAGYRNFFHPPSRWQFSGVRLARGL
ncbi:ergothioneine biosynthesis protein EgtB [Nannocystaceae bacterium ST9]